MDMAYHNERCTQKNQSGIWYVGPHESILEVGDDQHKLFQEVSNGPLSMKLIQYDEPSLKDNKKFDLLGNIKISGVDVSVVKGKRVDEMHRWAFPVICYPRNMLIYHYPIFGVTFMVILYVFIIKITLTCSQIITLNKKIGLFTPFYAFTRIYIQIQHP